jgi:hypothetical protein
MQKVPFNNSAVEPNTATVKDTHKLLNLPDRLIAKVINVIVRLDSRALNLLMLVLVKLLVHKVVIRIRDVKILRYILVV